MRSRIAPRAVLVAALATAAALISATGASAATGVPTDMATDGPTASTAYAPNEPIERKYHARGPWAVTRAPALGCCDSTGAVFDVWRPTDLGRDGFRHPIIAWGDGTAARPSQYDHLLSHLASWGFVVVAAHNPNTGSGEPILDSVRWAIAQNDREGSVLHGRLDPARVGAIGHSQGATGVVNALIMSRGRISTAIPIEIPSRVFCGNPASCADTRKLERGSLFLVNGSSDAVISPSYQLAPWQLIGAQSNSGYYEATPDHVDKVWATLNGVDHNDVQGQPDCAGASQPCGRGVDGFLGYPTAWMMDRLTGDAEARRAFVEDTGELFDDSPNWSNQHSNVDDSDTG